MNKKLLMSGMVLTFIAFPVSAHAQFSVNQDAPISGSADNADYQPGVTVLSGQVDVRQGESRVLADVMRIYSTPSQDGGGAAGAGTETGAGAGAFDNISRIEAVGNFYYITPEQTVRGKRGDYEQASNTFTVTGDVILKQGEDNVVTGDKLIYDLTTNKARVVGTCEGRKCGSRGRVNIFIRNTSESSSESAANSSRVRS